MPSDHEREHANAGPGVRVRTIVSGALDAGTTTLDRRVLSRAGDACLVWIDLVNPDPAMLEVLQEAYDLHPLAVNEVFETHRTSDVSFFNGTTHLVVQYPRQGPERQAIRAQEVQVIVGHGFFISIHRPNVLDIDAMIDQWNVAPEAWRSTSSSLLYATFRAALSQFAPVVDHLDEALESLEDAAINPHNGGTPKRQLLYSLFNVTEQITDLHNIAEPVQDAMRSLEHNSAWFSHELGNAYTRDVVDDAYHLARRLRMLSESAARLFDMVNTLVTLQRTDVSKQLTIVATIFLPLSFVASYFGQNFTYMTDGVASRGDYLIWGVLAPLASLIAIFVALWRFGAFR